MLQKIISDTGDYAGQAKKAAPRMRPYAEDATIVPCDMDYLKPNESYPSGHAMNGYVVAAVLSKMIPSRQQAILTRGVRYGDNRIICGVHHPTDVEQGRLLGVAYLEALPANANYEADLACAIEEELERIASARN